MSTSAGEGRTRLLAAALLVASGLIAIAGSYAAVQVIARSWAACEDLEPPYAFGLLFGDFPLLAIVSFLVAGLSLWLLRRQWFVARLIAAGVVIFLTCGFAIVTRVPLEDAVYYEAFTEAFGRPESCGPRGVPTWWPEWLPALGGR